MNKITTLPLLIVLCTCIVLAESPNKTRVCVKIYEVFPVGGIVWAQGDKNGGIRSTMPVGSSKITSAFPQGIVLLDGGGAGEFHDSLIKGKIKRKVYWLDANCFPEGIGLDVVSQHELFVGQDRNTLEEPVYGCADSWASYRLKIAPEGISGKPMVLRLQFRKASKTDGTSRPEKMLLDRVLAFDYSRILLIGFPENIDGSPCCGVVYWLAILVKEDTS